MSDQYKALLKIRRQRELTKTLIASKKQKELEDAQSEEARKKQALEEFKDQRKVEQENIYDSNTNVEIDIKSVSKINAKISELKQRQSEHESVVDNAEKQTATQQAELQAARQEHLKQYRAVKKFEHLVDQQDGEQRREQERSEELKQEEITKPTSSNN